jgi:hypothetical protein
MSHTPEEEEDTLGVIKRTKTRIKNKNKTTMHSVQALDNKATKSLSTDFLPKTKITTTHKR